MKKAVILLSGGLDSATCLAMAKEKGFDNYALSFDYGQRHKYELQSAQSVANTLKVSEHKTIQIDLRSFGGSALTDQIDVPKDVDIDSKDIPITYVPARNTIFLSLALAWAEVLKSGDIFIGVNAMDYSGYPDCRPEYIEAFQNMANLATKSGVEQSQKLTIHTPLIDLTKSEIIQKGMTLGVDYSQTHSCYDPLELGQACGHCDSCQLRLKGFQEAGFIDPLQY
ncbi:MAG: 7-cyano-7-deazaguanine synthase QueC [Candidatus Marinimicrobia bacterium]|jgi:7-cyano-7-deazaguanine synthase|nr:7-cyano-7-deazaguanine synthase QueC [Candidatus Neomarinimicrobiota bacterium]MBT3496991.1 7-cyano-7-deazaguanine synthase QueC [Candidatus Neomarinimicrobiota bacterium]MBT3691862.1 7-cyano-7-deazaguanine synthase QueC [Candidatus Neomarinimicrobiota bacterium]MBT3731506.1 7-cyano-7-deazaguanine synthase QueC [Candidatus Neomarinimicrobiota bacterium]MBT4144714.1 7-cyano-7-deazaguanine synthase QueC [Candidatus Neomarinimicrobiota bacterium]